MKKDSPELKDKTASKEEKKPREKKIAYEGSRWSSLILLCLTVLISFFLYLTGKH